jgi:hypothetical protein
MLSCRRGYSMLRMWHFIFEAVPKDEPVTLAMLDGDCFHSLEFPCQYSDDGRWIPNERPERGRSTDALARMAVTARLATVLPG